MKKNLLSFLLFCSAAAGAQNVIFEDSDLKMFFVNNTISTFIAKDESNEFIVVDVNQDGEIQQSEALLVYHLQCSTMALQSLGGLEYFTNLRTINCETSNIGSIDLSLPNLESINVRYNGALTSLDLAGCPNLREINCSDAGLTTLTIAGLANLEELRCSNNQLSSIDLTGLSNLWLLDVNNNNLTTIDGSTLTGLLHIYADYNNLTTINVANPSTLQALNYRGNPQMVSFDLSPYTGLNSLSCGDIGLTSLDLTGHNITLLHCGDNPLTSLNVAGNTHLNVLQCNNTLLTELDLTDSHIWHLNVNDATLLTSINMQNNEVYPEFGNFNINNTPNLQFICIDADEENSLLSAFENMGTTPPFLSTNCSFVPGQVYNTIQGTAILDSDVDGCEATDPVIPLLKLIISNGTDEIIKYTDTNGDYLKYLAPGSYTITPEFQNEYFNYLPGQANVTFAGYDGTVLNQDFCIEADGVHNDAEIILASGGSMPGFDASYTLIVNNVGTTPLSGTITLQFDDSVLDLVSAEPAEISNTGGLLTWNYNNLQPFEGQSIHLVFNLNGPTETPALNIDDVLNFTATTVTQQQDETPENNVYVLNQLVTGAFDPNNIICLEGNTAAPDAIGDYLNYVINFENTGNAAATFVVVTQQIDESQYNVGSLEMVSASHNIAASVTGNNVEFRFDDINLGAGAKGYVVYKIRSNTALEVGDSVINDASIVFDYNWPIITNEAETVFAALSTGNFTMDASVKIYPNPSGGLVNITASSNITSYELYDIQGRLLQSGTVNDTTAKFDISQRATGMYFVKVNTETGIKVEKVIRK